MFLYLLLNPFAISALLNHLISWADRFWMLRGGLETKPLWWGCCWVGWICGGGVGFGLLKIYGKFWEVGGIGGETWGVGSEVVGWIRNGWRRMGR